MSDETAVDLRLGPQADALRVRLRALLAELLPDDWTTPFARDAGVQAVVARTTERLADAGLLTMSWPHEYGGAGADVWQQTVLREEMWAHFEPRGPQYMGLNWVGPVIMEVGTPEQKALHLPGISAGKAVWCQGFSEPGAGSDLGSLQLRAEADGAGWVLNGQKIWTSYAGLAQWCFLAARTATAGLSPKEATGRSGGKHEGITIFLVPMDTPGITAVPIDSMLGEQHLNEVFFDNVRVGSDTVLGGVGNGWHVIRLVLKHERIGIPRYARDERVLADLAGHASLESPAALQAYAVALVHARVARLLNYRAVALREAGRLTDREASIARLASIQLDQEVGRLALDLSGADALAPDLSADGLLGRVEDVFRYARSATIASGTIEIQRMLVARSALASQEQEARDAS
jgi:alkylation response protein AidB-like acyl-CoA dehydrogenase